MIPAASPAPQRLVPARGPVPDAVSVVNELTAAGARRGDPVGLAVRAAGGLALAWGQRSWALPGGDPSWVAAIETALRPRWVWWTSATDAAPLVAAGVRPATCWDLAAVHRLRGGGGHGAQAVWAAVHGLDPTTAPRTGQLDLLAPVIGARPGASDGPDQRDDPEQPVGPDGHLRPEWCDGGWHRTPARLATWAALALTAHHGQLVALRSGPASDQALGLRLLTARAESTAELLCVELGCDGLPFDVAQAERLLTDLTGPRPVDPTAEARLRRQREEPVRRQLPSTVEDVDLRNPAHVRQALAAVGVDVPDTRSWRLEPWRGQLPLVDALLTWRQADRLATTYGYPWLDARVGPDGRLRGTWSASDAAAGRMTATAGLHNLPAELRPAVAADPGWELVRADLGQVEPRVLAAVSRDPALIAATVDDDLYQPVAARLRVERPVAKVAVLAAMYGQTSGTAGQALEGLEQAYPVAMRYLRAAYENGRAGRAVRTHGGRVVRMGALSPAGDDQAQHAAVNGRGRFARNAVVQGSAAELFKVWAVTVRAALAASQARIVLCLHDELLVHAPQAEGEQVAALLSTTLDDVAARWAGPTVRFVADVDRVQRWSDAT